MPVGLCVKRSPEMVVGMLGIIKAGAALYVPLDTDYPPERMSFLVQDYRAGVVTQQGADWLAAHRHRKSHLPRYRLGIDRSREQTQSDASESAG